MNQEIKRINLNLTIARRSLYNFKLRSALALLGVFLGAFSLIVVSNLAGSLSLKTKMEINKLGENLLIIKGGIIKHFGAKARLFGEANNLTIDDAKSILHGSKSLKRVSSSSSTTMPVRYGKKVLSSMLVVGVLSNYPQARSFYPQKGRFISKNDNDNLSKVVVLGASAAYKIFGDKNPVGKYILLRRAPCLVVGIMEEKGVDISGADQDNQIFIPLNTFLRRFVNKNFIGTIYAQAANEESIPSAKKEIEYILRYRHKIRAGEKDDFTVIDLKDVMALKTQATDMITVLGKISAVISFLIGGIGILSIMILIVNERKIEIGIRRAVGAKKKDIIFQFLMESSIVSLGGGAIGVVSGFVASLIIYKVSGLPFNISINGLVFSFIASVTTGILAGIYPARKAIAVCPVDVIRS